MKSLLLSLIFILIFSLAAFAQTNENLPCPTIEVIGPAEISTPNEPIIFRAEVSQEVQKFNSKYNWSVSSGEIIKGHGTLTIKVLRKELGESITAAFEITGLPKECVNTVSETEPICSCIEFRKIDEFSTLAPRIDKARLDYLISELQNNPNAVAYILEKFGRGTSGNARKLKIRKLTDYLFKVKKIKRDRIIIWYANSTKTATQFFIVPAGATPPTCSDCFL